VIEFLVLAALIAAAAQLAWLSMRARRAKNRFLRWIGAGSAAVLSASVALVSVIVIAGLFRLHARDARAPDLEVVTTPERIQRGKAIADGFCSGCHTKTGILTGGLDIGKHFPMPIGSFISSNLTPAGQLSDWSDGDIFRAIRNSVDRDGHWLVIMSYTNAGKLSDDDTQALVSYIRSLSAAGQQTGNPPDHFNFLGLMMLGAGLLPQGKPVSTSAITAPPKGPTMQFGEYILSYQDCRACHGERLTGGVPGQLGPLGPNLNVVKEWKREEFIATMRTGIDPNGHRLGKEMPWRPIGRMDDDELTAIYQYLTQLPDS
jgi:mono/diheme cytochrome c family protein